MIAGSTVVHARETAEAEFITAPSTVQSAIEREMGEVIFFALTAKVKRTHFRACLQWPERQKENGAESVF